VDNEELARILEVSKMLEAAKQPAQSDRPTRPPVDATGKFINALPIIITIIGAIFFTGIQTQKWNDSTDKAKLELQREFSQEMAKLQDRFTENYRELEDDNRELSQNIRTYLTDIERLKEDVTENKESVRLLQRSNDDLYRSTQYLKSLHNITPPK
jgi:uncharacterized protein HemX